MIWRIGVLYQDVSSLGFLEGLKKRLGCEAELVPPPGHIAKSQHMTRWQARRAWRFFQAKQVDIVVRFTDADRTPWQTVKRDEIKVFQGPVQDIMVCGVADNNTEEWLCLEPSFVAEQLGIDATALRRASDRSSVLKRAITRNRAICETVSQVVERLVTDAPENVFKQWLKDPALRDFYSECRRIASQFKCKTRNEL